LLRLDGPDALPDAADRFAAEAAAFGAITDNDLTERERSYWSSVERIRPDDHSSISEK
jgi:hypothetical protein